MPSWSRVPGAWGKVRSWLRESGLVNPCILCTDPDPALDQFEDISAFKPYLVDTGLLLTMCIGSNMADRQEIYREVLAGRLGMNKGMFFENMVAQSLVANGVRLHYYVFEDSGRKHELDFLMADGKRLTPIEVKSGRSGSHPSLDAFMDRNRKRAKVGYVVHSKNLRVEGDVVYLPIYLLWLLGRWPRGYGPSGRVRGIPFKHFGDYLRRRLHVSGA